MTERAANFLIHGHNNRVDVRGDITPFGVPGIAAGRMAFAAPPYGELRLFLLTRSPSQWILTNNVLAAFATCPEFRDVAVTVIPPGAIVAVHEGEWKLLPKHPPVNVQEVNQRIAALEHAVADVDTALRYEIRQIVARRRPLRLLLSGGVDSGLLASHLREEQADVVALTLRTPWGNEIEGAACTANHVGIPLEIIDVTAEELEAAIPRCMRLLQTSDAESSLYICSSRSLSNWRQPAARTLSQGWEATCSMHAATSAWRTRVRISASASAPPALRG